MKALTLIRLRAELALRRLNPLWLGVILVWLASIGLLVGVLPIMHDRLRSAEQELAALELRRKEPPAPPVMTQAAIEQEHLERFNAMLGDDATLEQQLEQLFGIATDLELALPQGQYRLNCEAAGNYCNYRIQLPVSGTYPLVRTFLGQALRAIPFASVNEVAFRREGVSDSDVEARIDMSFFTKSNPRLKTSTGGRVE
jgi:hypothetical protein